MSESRSMAAVFKESIKGESVDLYHPCAVTSFCPSSYSDACVLHAFECFIPPVSAIARPRSQRKLSSGNSFHLLLPLYRPFCRRPPMLRRDVPRRMTSSRADLSSRDPVSPESRHVITATKRQPGYRRAYNHRPETFGLWHRQPAGWFSRQCS